MTPDQVHKNARMLLEAATTRKVGFRQWNYENVLLNAHGLYAHEWSLGNSRTLIERNTARVIFRGMFHERRVKEFRDEMGLVKCLRDDCGYEGADEAFQYAAAHTFFKLYHTRACPKCGTTKTSYASKEWFIKKPDGENDASNRSRR